MGARISQRSKQDIIDRLDMAEIVGATVDLRRSGSSWVGLCPFHDERTPSFHVNVADKMFHCFGCGAGGDVITFVREQHGFSFHEAMEHLAEKAGVRLEYEDADPAKLDDYRARQTERRRLLDLNQAAQQFFVQQLQTPGAAGARAVIEKRKLAPETLLSFGVGYAPKSWDALTSYLLKRGFTRNELLKVGLAKCKDGGRPYDFFRERLMFPLHTVAGDLVGFGGRDLSGAPNVGKYLNSSESRLEDNAASFNHALSDFYKKGALVFGLWQGRRDIKKQKRAIVVEGNLDVMMLHQVGLKNTVCVMGTAVTPAQVAALLRFTDHAVLIFDGDDGGKKGARNIVPSCIEAGIDGPMVMLPEKQDPDEYVREHGVDALKKLIARSPNMIDGFIDDAVGRHGNSLVGKRKAIGAVYDVLSRISDPIVREMAKTNLARRLEIEPSDLHALIRRLESDPKWKQQQVKKRDTEMPWDRKPQPLEEPEIVALELDLVRILQADPKFIEYVDEQGCLEDVQHPGLRQTIERLAQRCRAHSAPSRADLRGWLDEMPDSRARRAFSRAMVEQERLRVALSSDALRFVLDRLECKSLQPKLDKATRRLKQIAGSTRRSDEMNELIADQQKYAKRIVELRESMADAIKKGAALDFEHTN